MTLKQDDDQGINNHFKYSKMNVVQLVKAQEGKLSYCDASGFDSRMSKFFVVTLGEIQNLQTSMGWCLS